MTHSHERTLLANLGFGDKDKRNPRHDLACQYLAQAPVFAKLMAPCLAPKCDVQSATIKHEHHITKGQAHYKTTIGFADLYTRDCLLTKRVAAPERILCPPFLVTEAHDEPTAPSGIMDAAALNSFAQGLFESMARVVQRQRAIEKRRQEAWLAWEAATARAPMTEFLVFANISVLIEVKIERVSVGDILRQMRLYSEYLAEDLGRVARAYAIPPAIAGTPRYLDCPRPTDDFGYANPEVCRCSAGHGLRRHHFGDPDTWVQSHQIVVTDFSLTSDEVETLRSAGIAHARLGSGFEAYLASQVVSRAHESPRI